MDGKRRKFALLLCAEDPDYVKRRCGGYFGVFVALLAKEGEVWDCFRVCKCEFPEEEKLSSYDGFVISGSCNDAHGDDPWIRRLIALLASLHSMRKKLLGICFGHQILSRMLGGKTGRATKGWDLGVTTVNLTSSYWTSLNSSLHSPIPSSLPVIECHRDEVLELAEGAEMVAWSEKTGIEMFVYGDHVMGIQGHPEYTTDILSLLLDRLLQRNLIQVEQVKIAKKSLEAMELNREAWEKLCKNFLTS